AAAALRDGPDRGDRLLDGAVFQHVTGRARLDRLKHVRGVLVDGEDADVDAGPLLFYALRDLDAVEFRQLDVGRHDVRVSGVREGDGLPAARRLPDDLNVLFQRQQAREGVARQALVFRDDNGDLVHALRFHPVVIAHPVTGRASPLNSWYAASVPSLKSVL